MESFKTNRYEQFCLRGRMVLGGSGKSKRADPEESRSIHTIGKGDYVDASGLTGQAFIDRITQPLVYSRFESFFEYKKKTPNNRNYRNKKHGLSDTKYFDED